VIVQDYEILYRLMFVISKLEIPNNIVSHVEEDDGPYFALTKAERYVNKFKKGIYGGMDNSRRS
jgi:hypothetical protein